MKTSISALLLASCLGLLSLTGCFTEPDTTDELSSAGSSNVTRTITAADPSKFDAQCVADCADEQVVCLDGAAPDLVCEHSFTYCVKQCPTVAP